LSWPEIRAEVGTHLMGFAGRLPMIMTGEVYSQADGQSQPNSRQRMRSPGTTDLKRWSCRRWSRRTVDQPIEDQR
jgi:hypothetical protein